MPSLWIQKDEMSLINRKLNKNLLGLMIVQLNGHSMGDTYYWSINGKYSQWQWHRLYPCIKTVCLFDKYVNSVSKLYIK